MKTKMFITLLLLVAAFFAQCQTDVTVRNLDVRDKSKLRGLIYPFGAVASNLNPNTDEVAMVRTTNFTLIRVDFWEFLDSIANHISGTPDTFYLAYGCYGNIDGWKHSGDTIFVDTCFSAGDSCYWYKDSDTLKPKHDYVRVPKLFADRMFYQGGTGDVNDSHSITGTDAQWIWQYLTGARTFTKWQKMEADLDGDGFITQSDADIVSGIVAMKYPNSLTLYDSLKRKIGLYNTGLDGNTDFHIRRLALLDSLPLGNKSKIMVSYYDAMKSADVIKYIPWDSITANIPSGSIDTFYVAHGCYNDPDGWKYSGDTIYIDTCFSAGGDSCEWVKDNINDEISVKSNTTQVGIGTHDPTEMLDVVGNINVPTTTASVGLIKENGTTILHSYHEKNDNNIFLGQGAGNFTLDSSFNVGIGKSALTALTTGYNNIGIGYRAGNSTTTGYGNIYIGINAGQNGDNNLNTVVGVGALAGTNSGANTAIGYGAMGTANGTKNANVAVGSSVMENLTNGYYNVGMGNGALKMLATGLNNTAVGTLSAQNTTGGNNAVFGFQALFSNKGNNGTTAVGYNAMYYADDRASGRTTYNTAIGYEAMKGSTTAANNTGQYCTAVGYSALTAMTSGASNIAIGYLPLGKNTTGNNNTSIGNASLYENLIGVGNTGVGNSTLRNNSGGNYNTAVGYEAMYYANSVVASTNTFNAALGYRALYGSTTAANNTGVQNSAVGVYALMNNTSGDYCVAVGTSASYTNSTGDDNTAIGYSALYLNQTGTNNVALGYQAAYNETGSNKLYIESSNSTTPLIYGEFDNDIVRVYGTKVERTDKTIADNDATPDVSASNVWTYAGSANAVTITDLDNPDVGAIYYLIGNDDTYTMTIADGGNFNLSASWTGGHDDVLILYCIADNNYIEFGRVDN